MATGEMKKNIFRGSQVKSSASGNVSHSGKGFKWIEVKSGKKRGIEIWQTKVPGAKKVSYRCDPSPVDADEKWYHDNVKTFYDKCAEAAARSHRGEEDPNGPWPDNVRNVKINKINYDLKMW